MDRDTVITGSDDWTARMWSIARGTCDAVLACHAGPVQCVEYSSSDRGIITGWHLKNSFLLPECNMFSLGSLVFLRIEIISVVPNEHLSK